MHITTTTITFSLFLASLTSAIPTSNSNVKRQDPTVCPGALFENPQCCSTDVLGLADLNCADRKLPIFPQLHHPHPSTLPAATADMKHIAPTVPTDVEDFEEICSSIGEAASCCVLPIVSLSFLPVLFGKEGRGHGLLCDEIQRLNVPCSTSWVKHFYARAPRDEGQSKWKDESRREVV